MTARIHATFPDGSGAREAGIKLQALRVLELEENGDGISFTATVGDEMVDRALHLIRDTGGTADM
ncbi:hypothetical protein K0T92_03115 [Paenibacillus oenotherae]|uniref:Uncharacterized protein n=1 Tax=Paenibacillus oenotherae TaxID=1435645 RepID=A0ABS7D1F4_9BACL|nr:hypothetical protein [Paenibacillus oenotherae]MBW7473733.1 hypothetical protein [Paenibacillus oenotherae]